jgi:hypothetical protein
MDSMTLATRDSSAFFIRNTMTLPTAQRGYNQPLINTAVVGEWYHFNGGKQYEDGSGNNATHANNRVQPLPVRRNGVVNQGVPDSGIGPVKIFAVLTRIQGANYTPPGPGRHSVWGREVTNGVFNPAASATNGRFVAFNPGHAGNEYTVAGGYIGYLFLSTMRWVMKDDRGCRNPLSSNYNSLATVNDGTCLPVGIGHDALLEDPGSGYIGRVSLNRSGIAVSVGRHGAHTVVVAKVNGQKVFHQVGNDGREYTVPGLEKGFYLVRVEVGGQVFKKMVSIQ